MSQGLAPVVAIFQEGSITILIGILGFSFMVVQVRLLAFIRRRLTFVAQSVCSRALHYKERLG